MTSAFAWQNSISLCPALFHIPRPNLPVTPGVSWFPTFAFQSPIMKRTSFFFFNFKIFNSYMRSQSWTPLPPPSPQHLSGSSPCTSPKHADIDWQFNSYMIVYMLECHSPKSSHPLPLPLSPKAHGFFTTDPPVKVKVKSLSRVWLFATPWGVAYQASPSVGFSRQEYWNGLPFPSPIGHHAFVQILSMYNTKTES